MNWWVEQVQRIQQTQGATDTPDLPVFPSYPFPDDEAQAALVWDLCRTGDAIVVASEDGRKSIVVL